MATVLVLVLSRGHKHNQGKRWLKSCFRFFGLTGLFLSCCETAEREHFNNIINFLGKKPWLAQSNRKSVSRYGYI